MSIKTFILFCCVFAFAICPPISVNGQLNINHDAVYMFGSIENDNRMTGFFSHNKPNFARNNQCVFIGANEKVYRLSLTDKYINELFIDGKKIDDSQIWKHTAEFKPFLMKFWRQTEIENEIEKFEKKISPLSKKIEEIDKEIEKTEQELDKISEKNSSENTKNQNSLKDKVKKLRQEQKEFESKLTDLENSQEKFDEELETLNLHSELEKVLQQITKDLESIGVVKNRANLSFKLSNKELVVNGKKLTDDAFGILKMRYVFDTQYESGFVYRWKGKF